MACSSYGCASQLILRVLLLSGTVTSASKILLLPFYSYSHCRPLSAVGNELSRRGHDVFTYLPDQFADTACFEGSPVTILKFKMKQQFWEELMHVSESTEYSNPIMKLRDLINPFCSGMFLDHEQDLENLKSIGFHLVIADLFRASRCQAVIPTSMRVPYIGYSAFYHWWQAGQPFLPNIIPAPIITVDGSMKFHQRLANTLFYLGSYYADALLTQDIETQIMPPGVSSADLVTQAAMYVSDASLLLTGPVPWQPNLLMTGGYTPRPPKALVKEFSSFIAKHQKGIVVISFGSVYSDAKPNVVTAINHASTKLQQYGFVWKTAAGISGGNVLRTRWMPQNDLLGSTRTRIFVTHCGRNSFYEAIHHGVPTICIPHGGDQFFNGAAVKRVGLGVSVNAEDIKNNTLAILLTSIIENSTYARNAKHASEIYKDLHPEPPEVTVAKRIEHVIKYGGDHLRPATYDMSLLSVTMLDVWFIIFSVVIISLLLLCYFVKRIYSIICCRGTQKQKTN